jgi:hypothetical protein
MTPEDFFQDRVVARELFDAVLALMRGVGTFDMRISKSQIALKRRRDFAWMWCPDLYLRGHRLAPLVLSLSLPLPDTASRWKEIVEPSPGRFMHHLEVHALSEIDEEVRSWLQQAYAFAA